ncbi:MAG: YhfC family intramembrane metalloprotease [Clostridiales bacterium]|nr:YhfC family intramembrane metalloprotease [Clostridiales bacterium]
MDYGTVSNQTLVMLGIGAVIFLVVPIIIAIIWKKKKKEPFTTILIGAATFLLFVTVEKVIQSFFIADFNPLGTFINARPVLWAFVVGFFPGLFEETGRLVAFKTLLRKRNQRETSISYGLGHGGIGEVSVFMTYTMIVYVLYAFMINSGEIKTIVDQVRELSPSQLSQIEEAIRQLTEFTPMYLLTMIIERVFAVLFHTGASIMVFYACKDKKFWLYPLAIVFHTLIDMLGGLMLANVISIPGWAFEVFFAAASSLIFFGAYFLLYRKDTPETVPEIGEEV